MSILEFDKVSYQYPSEDFDIIDQLSFRVEPGSFHCILGVSGCGKSTIFRLINGLLKPKAGEIKVGGAPIAGRKRYCGYMPQKDLLFPWRTVGENVALPLEVAGGLNKAQRQERAEAALAEVGLAGCAGKLPGEPAGLTYDLEYGSARIEIPQDSFPAGARVLMVDDLLATGGTAAATLELARRFDVDVLGATFLIELVGLGGRDRLPGTEITTVWQIED